MNEGLHRKRFSLRTVSLEKAKPFWAFRVDFRGVTVMAHNRLWDTMRMGETIKNL